MIVAFERFSARLSPYRPLCVLRSFEHPWTMSSLMTRLSAKRYGGRVRNPGWLPRLPLRGLIVALGLMGCGQGPLEANGAPSHTLTITAGRGLEVILQTIGPGEYESPPLVSSSGVRFLDVGLVTPAVPAGPTQRFRFEAVGPGVAVIVFHHTGQGPTIEDTIIVQ